MPNKYICLVVVEKMEWRDEVREVVECGKTR